MARSFSEQEKKNIKNSLLDACRQSWTQYGYKKTSVDELCRQVGISKGAFYLFFESKEALFCDVLCQVQDQICDAAQREIERYEDKRGAAAALKLVYREYDRNNFLYNADSQDFTVLMNKLSEEQAERIAASNRRARQLFAGQPHLKFAVKEDLAMAVIYSLIMNVKNKAALPCDHLETFDFMADRLIDAIYE